MLRLRAVILVRYKYTIPVRSSNRWHIPKYLYLGCFALNTKLVNDFLLLDNRPFRGPCCFDGQQSLIHFVIWNKWLSSDAYTIRLSRQTARFPSKGNMYGDVGSQRIEGFRATSKQFMVSILFSFLFISKAISVSKHQMTFAKHSIQLLESIW